MAAPPAAYLRLMRPADWLKNLLALAALVFSGKLTNPRAGLLAAAAFAAFTLMSSGFYAVNDSLDVESDRAHPLKRRRPVAAGLIPASSAFRFGLALILAGLVAGLLVRPMLGAVCALYVLLQIAYNARLKRMALFDVTALAVGFVLRAVGGAVAIDVKASVWLVLCVFFLCSYLGFIKRLSDLTSARREHGEGWRSPAGYDNPHELNWMLAVSATLAVMTYLLYALSPHPLPHAAGDTSIGFALLTPVVIIAVQRLYRRAGAGLSDRPFDAMVQDRGFLLCVVLFVAGAVLTLYVRPVEELLERLFMR